VVTDDHEEIFVELKETFPQHGAQDFYHRDNLIIEFTDDVDDAWIELIDEEGTVIPCESEFNASWTAVTFDPFGDSMDEHLAVEQSYTAFLSWDDHEPVELNFATSDLGTTLTNGEDSLIGRDFWLDLGTIEFTSPTGVGVLLSQYLADLQLVMHVEDVGDHRIEMIGGFVERVDDTYTQNPCYATTRMSEQEESLWDNPYFEAGPADLDVELQGTAGQLTDLIVGASFTTDGQLLVGTIDTELDMRLLDQTVDPGGNEGAACELMANLGLSCQVCSSGAGPYCMELSGYGMTGEPIEAVFIHPETDEANDTLTEVTEEQVEDWINLGYCD